MEYRVSKILTTSNSGRAKPKDMRTKEVHKEIEKNLRPLKQKALKEIRFELKTADNNRYKFSDKDGAYPIKIVSQFNILYANGEGKPLNDANIEELILILAILES